MSEYAEGLKAMKEVCDSHPSLVFMDKTSYLTPEGVRILGTILWSHIPESKRDTVLMCLTDYRKIRIKDEVNGFGDSKTRGITPAETDAIYQG